MYRKMCGISRRLYGFLLVLICLCLAFFFPIAASARAATAPSSFLVTPLPSFPISTAPATARQDKLKLFWGLFGGNKKQSSAGGGNKDDIKKVKARIASCKVCNKKGAIDCPTCAGTGIDKKNGAVFERYKCLRCQGFGYVSCDACNPGGLTPEQQGLR